MVTLAAVGDVSFAGPLSGDPEGFVSRIAPDVRALLHADILIADLESVLLDDVSGLHGQGRFPAHSPTKAVEALKRLGINLVTLANNHITDYGDLGLKSTISVLDEAGIAHVGAGLNLCQAESPAVIESKGMRIGFLGFGESRYPTSSRGGSIPFREKRAFRLIETSKCRCDFLVVYIHEGVEALTVPLRRTVVDCHRAVDSGADLIIGSHPHTAQGIEDYAGVPIAYSLGNFIMSMREPVFYEQWKKNTALTLLGEDINDETTRRGLVLRCEFADGAKVSAQGHPIRTGDGFLPTIPEEPALTIDRDFHAQLNNLFKNPEDDVWRTRDRIESSFNRMALRSVGLWEIIKNLPKLRMRHLRAFLRSVFG